MMNPTNRISASSRLCARLVIAAACIVAGSLTQASDKPNGVLIFIDDKY